MNPLISVIVPVYNVEKYLRQCIDSILAQTYKNFELILVDDGSKDKSGEICDEYAKKDPRIRVYHKKNGGASSARNYGLDNAKGEYISFCDSDDYVEPSWLSIFIDGMSNADMVISSMSFIREDIGIERSIYKYNINDPALGWTLLELQGESGFPVNKCYRSVIIEKYKIRFNESYVLYEDEEFVSNYLSHAASVSFSKEATYNYVIPANWLNKYRQVDIYECSLDIYNHMAMFVPKEGFFVQGYSSIIGRLISGLMLYYEQRQYKKAKQYLYNICNIVNSMPEMLLYPLNRPSRFFFKKKPLLSHVIYIIMSVLKKNQVIKHFFSINLCN